MRWSLLILILFFSQWGLAQGIIVGEGCLIQNIATGKPINCRDHLKNAKPHECNVNSATHTLCYQCVRIPDKERKSYNLQDLYTFSALSKEQCLAKQQQRAQQKEKSNFQEINITRANLWYEIERQTGNCKGNQYKSQRQSIGDSLIRLFLCDPRVNCEFTDSKKKEKCIEDEKKRYFQYVMNKKQLDEQKKNQDTRGTTREIQPVQPEDVPNDIGF